MHNGLMPLPPAPTQKASILPKNAYQGSSTKSSKPRRGARAADDVAGPEALGHPAAFEPSTAKPAPAPASRQPGRTGERRGGSPLKNPTAAPEGPALVAEPVQAAETAKQSSTQNRSQSRPRGRAARSQGPTKLFVLDTNVLLHDPMCLFRFEEHDIFLPMIVLEELDGHKKGMTEVARNARQTSRTLDALAAAQGADIAKGLLLSSTGHSQAGGHLLFQTRPLSGDLPMALPQGKADNQILGVVEALRKELAPREVVLVS